MGKDKTFYSVSWKLCHNEKILIGLKMWNKTLKCFLPVFVIFNLFNSIQVYLYSAFYDTIVAKQIYRKLSFYNIL